MNSKGQLELSSIPDDQLLSRLREILQQSRRVESELVAHIGEVDQRRLYAREASSSMFVYCVENLHLSEPEAYLRITVARAARKYPVLLEMLAEGRLHLTGIAKLAPVLTEENRDRLLARAAGKTKRQIEELVAEVSPKPDVPATMRKLPERREKSEPPPRPLPELRPDGVRPGTVAAAESTRAHLKPAVVEPLAPARFKIQFTASAELRDKLERLRVLMRSSVPDGDLATLIEEAVTEKLERLESKRLGKTKAPRKSLEETDTSPSSRYIPAPVRRAVYERDGGQCRFLDEHGRRCTETERLEFHHLEPYGRGGNHHPSNIRLMCKVHNGLLAERDYGKEVMEHYRCSGGRVSEPSPVYNIGNRAFRAGAMLASHAPFPYPYQWTHLPPHVIGTHRQ
jgi:hypothetical protein